MKTRRQYRRCRTAGDATAHFNGRTGWIFNISRGGLSLLYPGPVPWPEDLTLDLSTRREAILLGRVRCTKVWESAMEDDSVTGNSVIRRMGVRFEDTDSRAVLDLLDILDIRSG